MSEASYPIAHRYEVPPKKGVFDTVARRLKEIPGNQHEFAVVLDVNGFCQRVPHGLPIDRADSIQLATAVVFVDTRRTFIDLEFELPAKSYLEVRAIVVRYESQVVDPVRILEERVGDLRSRLEYWTRSLLTTESVRFALDSHQRFEQSARQAIVAGLVERPPIPGTAVSLQLIEVSAALADGRKAHARTVSEATRRIGHPINEVQERKGPAHDGSRNKATPVPVDLLVGPEAEQLQRIVEPLLSRYEELAQAGTFRDPIAAEIARTEAAFLRARILLADPDDGYSLAAVYPICIELAATLADADDSADSELDRRMVEAVTKRERTDPKVIDDVAEVIDDWTGGRIRRVDTVATITSATLVTALLSAIADIGAVAMVTIVVGSILSLLALSWHRGDA